MSDDVIKYSSDNQEVISRAVLPEDQEPEILSLRPERLSVYVGQKEVVETLKIAIQAATERGEPIDHVLFHGPPGLGKTTLAHIIANEMGANLRQTSGPVLEKASDLAALLTNLKPGDVLFVDEIHRFNKAQQDAFLPHVESGLIILIGGICVVGALVIRRRDIGL